MKRKMLYSFLFSIVVLFCFSSCEKDESNPVNGSNFPAKGSDYLPLSSGKIIKARISGSATEYDSLGSVTRFTQISNEIYNVTIGASTFIRNMNANPIFGNYGGKSELLCYLSNNNGEIIGFDKNSNSQLAVVLPSELTIGKEWAANPQNPSIEQFKVKLVESINSFTNSAGKTFQNVINVLLTYDNLVGDNNSYQKTVINANVYLSKDIGVIGVKLNDYEEIVKYNFFGFNYYKRTKANGEMGITD